MYHNILTQQDCPEYDQIKKVIKLLRAFIKIDAIYFSKHLEEPSNNGIITVLISKSNPHYYEEIYDFSWKIMKSYPEFSFSFYDEAWLKAELEEGNLYAIMNCDNSQLLYSASNFTSVVDFKKIKPKKLIKKVTKRFKRHNLESNIIGRDLRYYNTDGRHLSAAYNVHQQFRYLFINISWFLAGDYTGTESLEEQVEYLRKFSIVLANTFDPEKKEEWFVLKQLDEARTAIQWNKEIEPITKETIDIAYEKLAILKEEVRRVLDKYIKRVKIKLENLVSVNKKVSELKK